MLGCVVEVHVANRLHVALSFELGVHVILVKSGVTVPKADRKTLVAHD